MQTAGKVVDEDMGAAASSSLPGPSVMEPQTGRQTSSREAEAAVDFCQDRGWRRASAPVFLLRSLNLENRLRDRL